ncbi:hypothetical protein Hanom_Chr05g00421091 [Helianthus anomalus]
MEGIHRIQLTETLNSLSEFANSIRIVRRRIPYGTKRTNTKFVTFLANSVTMAKAVCLVKPCVY